MVGLGRAQRLQRFPTEVYSGLRRFPGNPPSRTLNVRHDNYRVATMALGRDGGVSSWRTVAYLSIRSRQLALKIP
jgi:hypothetical protein